MSEPETDEVDVVTLTDEDGEDRDFAFVALVDLDEGRFAVMAPVDQLEGESPDLELYGFHYIERDDGIELDAVEDTELLDKLFAAAEDAFSEPDLSDEA